MKLVLRQRTCGLTYYVDRSKKGSRDVKRIACVIGGLFGGVVAGIGMTEATGWRVGQRGRESFSAGCQLVTFSENRATVLFIGRKRLPTPLSRQIILLLFIVLDPFGNMVTINSLLQEMEPGRRRMVMLLVMMAVQMVLDGIRLYQQAG